jgi:drug/metabolite transporter (DMT)-like permease
MAAYGGEILLLKKSASVFFLLPGILLVVGGQNEQSSPVIAFGILSLLGGVLLFVLKIVRRNQGNQP